MTTLVKHSHLSKLFNLQGVLTTSWPVTTHQFLQHLKSEWPHSLSQSRVLSPSVSHYRCIYTFSKHIAPKSVVWCRNSYCCFFPDPNSVSQGGIQFINCVATLQTKSKTKFFIEFHSSCLESMFQLFAWLYHVEFCFCGLDVGSYRNPANVNLNVHRNCEDYRGREHRAHRWVNKSPVWLQSWGKMRKNESFQCTNCLSSCSVWKSLYILFYIFQAHTHHLWPRVPFGPAHPHLCEINRLWRVLW